MEDIGVAYRLTNFLQPLRWKCIKKEMAHKPQPERIVIWQITCRFRVMKLDKMS